MEKKSVHSLIKSITGQLMPKLSNLSLSTQYAWWILQALTHKKEVELLMKSEIHWHEKQEAQLQEWLHAFIKEDMPLQYILGNVPFSQLEIMVKPPILIPRPETEEWALDLITRLQPLRNEPLSILDLCTGSGCIALALAQALPKAHVYGTDTNDSALALAKENAHHNQITNCTFLYSNLFEQIPHSFTFDIIVGNPPYIPEAEWPKLANSVKNWEDKNALTAKDQGLALIKKIIKEAPSYIKQNEFLKKQSLPHLLLEIDYTQAKEVLAYMQQHGYTDITIKKDLEGNDRVACGRVNHVASDAS